MIMAATLSSAKGSELSKAEYLKRYLSNDDASKASEGKLKKKRRKVVGKGLKIVDDDIDWKKLLKEEKEREKAAVEDEEEAPVIAEIIDDRPDEVKHQEIFKSSNRWKVIGVDEEEQPEVEQEGEKDSSGLSPSKRARHDSPDMSPPRRSRHDSPDASPPRRSRHDSPDISPPRRVRHDSPDMSPPRQSKGKSVMRGSKDKSLAKRKPRKGSDSDQSPPRRKPAMAGASDSDQSPPRRTRKGSDSDQSPPRRRPRGGQQSDDDLSPPRRPGQSREKMLSGGKAGLVSRDVLRKEQEENRRRDKDNQQQEDESRSSQTIFRDKSGRKRDLASEREELERQASQKALRDEKYAQWGRGLVQGQMYQQQLEDGLRESQKPLARHSNDDDLDRMLREQEREGDPMADMLRKKKERTTKTDKPRYKGPLPPMNRFNLLPGYRWDGVNRSNGFEEKRYARLADKEAMREAAYKWSVEDM